jgi:hypothetical protein
VNAAIIRGEHDGVRVVVALGVASAGLHVLLLPELPAVPAILMSLAFVACLRCAYVLWRRPTPGAFISVGLMNVAMLALHIWAMSGMDDLGTNGGASPHHHHETLASSDGAWALMNVATATASAEVVVALLVGCSHILRERARRQKHLAVTSPGAGDHATGQRSTSESGGDERSARARRHVTVGRIQQS